MWGRSLWLFRFRRWKKRHWIPEDARAREPSERSMQRGTPLRPTYRTESGLNSRSFGWRVEDDAERSEECCSLAWYAWTSGVGRQGAETRVEEGGGPVVTRENPASQSSGEVKSSRIHKNTGDLGAAISGGKEMGPSLSLWRRVGSTWSWATTEDRSALIARSSSWRLEAEAEARVEKDLERLVQSLAESNSRLKTSFLGALPQSNARLERLFLIHIGETLQTR